MHITNATLILKLMSHLYLRCRIWLKYIDLQTKRQRNTHQGREREHRLLSSSSNLGYLDESICSERFKTLILLDREHSNDQRLPSFPKYKVEYHAIDRKDETGNCQNYDYGY